MSYDQQSQSIHSSRQILSDPSRWMNTMQWLIENFWKVTDITESVFRLRLYSLFILIWRDWTVLRRKTRLFLLQQHWATTHCCLSWKRLFGGEGAVWYPVSIYVSEGRYDSFYRLALYNKDAWPNFYFLKSKKLKCWLSHGDMTLYGHATILAS